MSPGHVNPSNWAFTVLVAGQCYHQLNGPGVTEDQLIGPGVTEDQLFGPGVTEDMHL